MSEQPTPETDALAEKLITIAQEITEFNAQSIIKQLLTEILTKTTKLERERDEAREALADWENAAAHVESDHPDERHCGCVPVLRKLLADARKERDEARELCRELADLVAYGLGQSAEPWSLDAMRQATYAIQKTKQLDGRNEQRGA